MATMIRQLSYDFDKTQNVFSAMLPKGAKVLGGDMFGRAPVMWVLADWEQEQEKHWFLYTICNTPIDDVQDPTSILPRQLDMSQLEHVCHYMQVDNERFPPVIPWNLFAVKAPTPYVPEILAVR